LTLATTGQSELAIPHRVEVLGVPVDCVDMQSALTAVHTAIAENQSMTILAVNPEKVMGAQTNAGTLSSLQKAGMLIPDGIGVVWAVRFLTEESIERVPGAELMPVICSVSKARNYRLFLYGASPETNVAAAAALAERYPGIPIVGRQHGYLPESEMPGLIDRINKSRADVLFVALGSPRQELWIERYRSQLSVKVYQGVGGTFDVLAGHVRRAPIFFQKLNLEWLYRLVADPRRISRQWVLPVFMLKVLWQKISNKG
jgi:N-acetylglucosaminyldiphosphoundecaprenol N-acetyl-beta-D-mannosaminyltransferase